MKRKSLLATSALLLCLSLNGSTNGIMINNSIRTDVDVIENKLETNEGVLINDKINNQVSPRTSATFTLRDLAIFFETRKEHYPLSDEYVERYQQDSGGYIDNARKAGLLVDKQKHEPNQKWHFFESWLYPSFSATNPFSWEDSAGKRINGLQCPELLLWIYEAAGVDPSKIKIAKDVAEKGEAAGTHSATLGKQIRECVPWEDVYAAIMSQINSNN